jgi:hypothetical protein
LETLTACSFYNVRSYPCHRVHYKWKTHVVFAHCKSFLKAGYASEVV